MLAVLAVLVLVVLVLAVFCYSNYGVHIVSRIHGIDRINTIFIFHGNKGEPNFTCVKKSGRIQPHSKQLGLG